MRTGGVAQDNVKTICGILLGLGLAAGGFVTAGDSGLCADPLAPIRAPFPMPPLKRPDIPPYTVDIRDFGARPGRGYTNTAAFRKAVGAVVQQGGGTVLIPAGEWFTGPIRLESRVNLHFEEGSSLYFLPDAALYLPPVRVNIYGFECYNFCPMIYAFGCTDIAVTGHGKLYGPGVGIDDLKTHPRSWNRWRQSQHELAKEKGVRIREMGIFAWRRGVHILQDAAFRTEHVEKRDVSGTFRLDPSLIQPVSCRNVLLEGFMIARGGPMWTINPALCTNVIIRKLAIHTLGTAGDAIDIVSCENVLIERCDIRSGDDVVALKSGINQEGWRVHRPVKNVVIRHINGLYADAGGISIGSELSGGVVNVYCHDNRMNVPNPFRIKSRPGRGGEVRNVTCERFIVGEPIRHHYTDWAFPPIPPYRPARVLIELNNAYPVMAKRVQREKGTRISGVVIRDFEATTVKTGIRVVSYQPNLFRDILLENIRIRQGRPGGIRQAEVTVRNYTIGGRRVSFER